MKRAYFELVFAGAFWGMGFIAAKWALLDFGPFLVTALRFTIGALFIDFLWRALKKPISYRFQEWKSLFPVGLFLFFLLGFQTWGLQHTTATRSGFITVLYVLFIPILDWIFHRTPIKPILGLWIIIALTGTGLICGFNFTDTVESFNWGDFLTLLCAFSAAFHFVWVNRTIKKIPNALSFHVYQCSWVALLAFICAMFLPSSIESPPQLQNTIALWGILFLGIFSSGLAFLFQIRSQKVLSPTTVGIISLLESPFALIFSVWLLNEHLTRTQLFGAFLILFAAIGETLSVYKESSKSRSTTFRSGKL